MLPYRRFARSGAVGAGARRSRVSVGQKGRSGISHNDEVVDAILALVRSTVGLNQRVEHPMRRRPEQGAEPPPPPPLIEDKRSKDRLPPFLGHISQNDQEDGNASWTKPKSC